MKGKQPWKQNSVVIYGSKVNTASKEKTAYKQKHQLSNGHYSTRQTTKTDFDSFFTSVFFF